MSNGGLLQLRELLLTGRPPVDDPVGQKEGPRCETGIQGPGEADVYTPHAQMQCMRLYVQQKCKRTRIACRIGTLKVSNGSGQSAGFTIRAWQDGRSYLWLAP